MQFNRVRLSMSVCKQIQSQGSFQGGGLNNMDTNFAPLLRQKDKVVIVMGATGTGKSRLAIYLAKHFDGEIVNSDKIQVYKGLDIVTNKVTLHECQGVPHHLIGIIDPDSDFTATDFRRHASQAIQSIIKDHDSIPIIAGGSNSFIEALINDDDEDINFDSKYECCFLWVHVSLPVLYASVSERVDKMVEAGLVDEVRQCFDPKADYSCGIRRAIGVPEMDHFLRLEKQVDDETRRKLLEEAIADIKRNTCDLVSRQLQKIHRLQYFRGWNLHLIDATEVLLKQGKEADEAWENVVANPCSMIVDKFLHSEDFVTDYVSKISTVTSDAATVRDGGSKGPMGAQ